MTIVNWELLNTTLSDKAIATYQALSMASMFPHQAIPGGIAAEEYAFKYMKESVAAAWHGMGFQPQEITLDFHGSSLKQTTIDQEITLTQKDQAFYAANGFMQAGEDEIAKNVAKTWNYACINGRSAVVTSIRHPLSQYNYLNEDGDGANGTAVRPLPMYAAANTTAWTTDAIAYTKISTLVSGMVAKGATKSNLIIGYPKIAESLWTRVLTGGNPTPIDYTLGLGVKDVIALEDEYMWTQAGAVPTLNLHDVWAFDPSQFVVLDGMSEKFQVVQGAGHDRNAYIQGEWWGIFLPLPTRKNEAGTIKTYKHFGRLQAVAPA